MVMHTKTIKGHINQKKKKSYGNRSIQRFEEIHEEKNEFEDLQLGLAIEASPMPRLDETSG